jgi:hypothetical protein
MVDFNFILSELLIGRRLHLAFFSKVNPELKTQRILLKRGRNLRVNDPPAGSHPLDVPRSYLALMAFEIFMVEAPLQHIGHCFKASMGVVREASRKSYFEEIEHQERI